MKTTQKKPAHPSVQIIQGTFLDQYREVPEASVDMIVCQVPAVRTQPPLWSELAQVSQRLLREGGSFVVCAKATYLDGTFLVISPLLNYLGIVPIGSWVDAAPWAKGSRLESLLFATIWAKGTPKNSVGSLLLDRGSGGFLNEVQCFAKLIELLSPEGGTVLDPWSAFSPTVCAARLAKRRAIGFSSGLQDARLASSMLAWASLTKQDL